MLKKNSTTNSKFLKSGSSNKSNDTTSSVKNGSKSPIKAGGKNAT
jgi:hypothetical protein